MLKKTIKYTAFDGEEYEEDFYFHLTKAEMVELELSKEGGMSVWIKTLSETRDGNIIIAEMKKLVLGSYGKKSADGKRFIKTQELRDEFESSEAYSEFFFSLVTDAEAAAEFANGIIPSDLAKEVAKVVGADLSVVPDSSDTELENGVTVPTITAHDMVSMSVEDYAKAKSDIEEGRLRVIDPITE